jgi:hypothetical protein
LGGIISTIFEMHIKPGLLLAFSGDFALLLKKYDISLITQVLIKGLPPCTEISRATMFQVPLAGKW